MDKIIRQISATLVFLGLGYALLLSYSLMPESISGKLSDQLELQTLIENQNSNSLSSESGCKKISDAYNHQLSRYIKEDNEQVRKLLILLCVLFSTFLSYSTLMSITATKTEDKDL